MNWMAINTDTQKIENICHGAVPGPKVDLQGLIQKHDSQEKLKSFASSIACEQALRGTGAGVEGEPARTALKFECLPSE